jgi:hypothetical protein
MATSRGAAPTPEDPKQRQALEVQIAKEFTNTKSDTKYDLNFRINGVSAKRGSSGYQFSGYTTLEQFYRGDQWDHDEPPGASQRTDNYCAVIVDNLSSVVFDEMPEVNCPTDDPLDDLLELRAEVKEKLINKVWKDNDAAVEFDELCKVGSLYGDTFIIGPYMEKQKDGKWKICFTHVENPASISLLFEDANYKKIGAFIHSDRITFSRANKLYGAMARARGIKMEATIVPSAGSGAAFNNTNQASQIPMVNIDEYWTDEVKALFVNDQLLNVWKHNWGFVPIQYIKNIHSPNHPYGKSDLEDSLDPQLMHNRTNNDLANFLKWISQVNMWGKNLEGMEALVAGVSKIYSVPEDGELHAFERPGDPYVTNTFVQQRRTAIVEISGVSDAMLSSSQLANSSGRALALAFQGTIRKLKPRIKRYETALTRLNENILKLMEIYFPETKKVIQGDFRNEVHLPTTLLRIIVDTINKLQSGVISLDTAQREAGISAPKLEQKLMRKNLSDPILGPQIARQPQLLPRLQEGQNQPGEAPMQGPGNRVSSAEGAPAAVNQNASGAAPVPAQ